MLQSYYGMVLSLMSTTMKFLCVNLSSLMDLYKILLQYLHAEFIEVELKGWTYRFLKMLNLTMY